MFRRLLAVLLVLAVVAAGAVGVAALLGRHHTPSAGPPLATSAPPTPTPTPTQTVDASAVRLEALQSLLQSRADAVLHHDSKAWLASVESTHQAATGAGSGAAPDTKLAAYRTRQKAVFANLVKIPLSAWSYQVVGPGPALSAARAATLGPEAWVAQVDVAYRIKGVDTVDAHATQYLTVVSRSGQWYLASDTDGPTPPQIWDLGPITVLAGHSSLVIGTGASASLATYVSQADAAVTRVSAVWGTHWPRKEVVIVPATQAQMGLLLQRSSSSLDQIAAVTTGELVSGQASGQGGADQVIINPSGFARLGTLGRRVVITHETTHVAVRASTPDALPTWLSEGFADYVGYSGTGLPRTDIASDVLQLVRQHKGPTGLPTTANFNPADGTIAPYYSAAYLACELISERYGQAKLVAFVRASAGVGATGTLASATTTPTTRTAKAFSHVLSVSQKSFTTSWLAYLQALSRD